MAAVERSIESQHQAAINAGQPWPPERQPQAATDPETVPETEAPRPGLAKGNDDVNARITGAVTDIEHAAREFREDQATRLARTGYAARISRQAEAQPEVQATPAAKAPADFEMEL
jgi:hypothetical protein